MGNWKDCALLKLQLKNKSAINGLKLNIHLNLQYGNKLFSVSEQDF